MDELQRDIDASHQAKQRRRTYLIIFVSILLIGQLAGLALKLYDWCCFVPS